MRAAVSVTSNIAEGYERTTNKEFLHFLDIVSGSLSELRTQLDIQFNRPLHIRQILLRDVGDRDVVDVQLVLADQVE